ncbi:MAG: type II toxin-antitoxin system death-on-curing family toxin [Candidatus Poribacteria bacterium]|nr:type II toxin-antitoxin system death-on-curing family toxin [Candidatus Poribacteria bacterium]
MKYLTIEDILIIAEGHVGDYQLLNENQLHYLVDIVGEKFGNIDLFPTVFQKAAVYAHHIITRHIFFDGNKRIGLTCAFRFLELNGYFRRTDIDDSIIDLGFKIADGTITDIEVIADRIQSWIL